MAGRCRWCTRARLFRCPIPRPAPCGGRAPAGDPPSGRAAGRRTGRAAARRTAKASARRTAKASARRTAKEDGLPLRAIGRPIAKARVPRSAVTGRPIVRAATGRPTGAIGLPTARAAIDRRTEKAAIVLPTGMARARLTARIAPLTGAASRRCAMPTAHPASHHLRTVMRIHPGRGATTSRRALQNRARTTEKQVALVPHGRGKIDRASEANAASEARSLPGTVAGPGTKAAPPRTQEGYPMAPSILEPMPAPVEERVERLLADGEQPRVSACTDMDAEGHFRGAWLVATERRLLIVAPETELEPLDLAEPLRARRRLSVGQLTAHGRARR